MYTNRIINKSIVQSQLILMPLMSSLSIYQQWWAKRPSRHPVRWLPPPAPHWLLHRMRPQSPARLLRSLPQSPVRPLPPIRILLKPLQLPLHRQLLSWRHLLLVPLQPKVQPPQLLAIHKAYNFGVRSPCILFSSDKNNTEKPRKEPRWTFCLFLFICLRINIFKSHKLVDSNINGEKTN